LKAAQSRIIAFFYTDKILTVQIFRKQLKKKVKGVVNNFGPQLFKNFDKLRLIAKEGSKPGSRAASKNATPYKGRSRAPSGDLDLDYKDQLELTRAFACLQELENI
jgi:hypothetical protein